MNIKYLRKIYKADADQLPFRHPLIQHEFAVVLSLEMFTICNPKKGVVLKAEPDHQGTGKTGNESLPAGPVTAPAASLSLSADLH